MLSDVTADEPKPLTDFYVRRLVRVMRHIDRHLDEELNLEELSRLAGFSKFHFHRQFRAFTGVGVAQWVRLLRLRQASLELAFATDRSVIDIAYSQGFGSSEGFGRAFKKALGQAPTEFRADPHWGRWHVLFADVHQQGEWTMETEIVNFPETRVAALEHCGDPSTVMRSVSRFIEFRKTTGISPYHSSETYGLAYDDPDTTAPEDYRFDICGSIEGPLPENDFGVVEKVIPAGRCAVARHVGSRDNIGETVYAIFRDWLPESGEELRDFPVFFHNVRTAPPAQAHDQITDVYVPLR